MGLFSTFEAVEILKRDKQIASLTAEIERLQADLRDWAECASVDVTMEGPRLMGWNRIALNRCLTKYEAALQPGVVGREVTLRASDLRELTATIASQAAEIERLRKALDNIASGRAFVCVYPTPTSITAPELEDGYLVAANFARAALQAGESDD